uniref:alpha-amylase family glycosyl hydrolase n=1 Tax=Paenibacillus sp. FSL H8-0168 TaxID=2921378 RepID=UPI00406D43E8
MANSIRGGFGGQLPLAYAPNPSPSYHKYDVTDYYQVYPLCGSLNDFRTLMKVADRQGVKVSWTLLSIIQAANIHGSRRQ